MVIQDTVQTSSVPPLTLNVRSVTKLDISPTIAWPTAKVNELDHNFGIDSAVNAFDVSSDDTFYVCNVKVSRKPGKWRIYANLKIDNIENYLWAHIDTATDINLMPTTVYTQIFKDPKMEFLGPMDINLSMYNDSAIQTLRTCVILLVSPINGHKHDTKFYVAQHSRSVLFSCEDSLYLQLIQPYPVLSKCTPHGANITSSKHDLAYINFVTRNKQASHYQPKQSSVPSQTTLTFLQQMGKCLTLSRHLPFGLMVSGDVFQHKLDAI